MNEESWILFRKTGLLHFVNLFLHIFGWCIVIETDEWTNKFKRAYPARCNYNGFTEKDEESFKKLRRFMDGDDHLWHLNRKEGSNDD